MKATLRFTLPDEEEEFEDAISGAQYHSALREVLEHLRQLEKYGEEPEVNISRLYQDVWAIVRAYNLEVW